MSNRHLGKEALRSVARRSSCHPGSEMGLNCPMEKAVAGPGGSCGDVRVRISPQGIPWWSSAVAQFQSLELRSHKTRGTARKKPGPPRAGNRWAPLTLFPAPTNSTWARIRVSLEGLTKSCLLILHPVAPSLVQPCPLAYVPEWSPASSRLFRTLPSPPHLAP